MHWLAAFALDDRIRKISLKAFCEMLKRGMSISHKLQLFRFTHPVIQQTVKEEAQVLDIDEACLLLRIDRNHPVCRFLLLQGRKGLIQPVLRVRTTDKIWTADDFQLNLIRTRVGMTQIFCRFLKNRRSRRCIFTWLIRRHKNEAFNLFLTTEFQHMPKFHQLCFRALPEGKCA